MAVSFVNLEVSKTVCTAVLLIRLHEEGVIAEVLDCAWLCLSSFSYIGGVLATCECLFICCEGSRVGDEGDTLCACLSRISTVRDASSSVLSVKGMDERAAVVPSTIAVDALEG